MWGISSQGLDIRNASDLTSHRCRPPGHHSASDIIHKCRTYTQRSVSLPTTHLPASSASSCPLRQTRRTPAMRRPPTRRSIAGRQTPQTPTRLAAMEGSLPPPGSSLRNGNRVNLSNRGAAFRDPILPMSPLGRVPAPSPQLHLPLPARRFSRQCPASRQRLPDVGCTAPRTRRPHR